MAKSPISNATRAQIFTAMRAAYAHVNTVLTAFVSMYAICHSVQIVHVTLIGTTLRHKF